MRIRMAALITGVVVLSGGCQADREVFDAGATLEAPPEVQEAPAYPVPPQPLPRDGATQDTALLDTLGQQPGPGTPQATDPAAPGTTPR